MKIIVVTGTPGTGKTTLAKNLAKKLNFLYLDINKLISEFKLHEGYDRKRGTRIVDVNKLNKMLVDFIIFFKKIIVENKNIEMRPLSSARSAKYINKIKILTKKFNKNQIKKLEKIKGIIIDSHLSHYLSRKYVDLCIVTKCGIKELNKRLRRKKFHKGKIQENLQAEIFDVCYNEAIGRKHKVITIDTTKGFNINQIARKLGG